MTFVLGYARIMALDSHPFSFALFFRGEEPLRLKLQHLKLPPNYAGLYFFKNSNSNSLVNEDFNLALTLE